MKRIASRLTYANVVSTLALFLVLAAGSAFAANQLAKNSVGPKQIRKNAVTATKIKDGAVTQAKLDSKAMAALTGPQGPKGEPGAAGAPGAALGYAHLIGNKLDASRSKGVIGATEGEYEGGAKEIAVVCFDLGITPSTISVTPQTVANSSSPAAEYWSGVVPAHGPRPSHAGCPAGFADAEVETSVAINGPPNGIWVVFF